MPTKSASEDSLATMIDEARERFVAGAARNGGCTCLECIAANVGAFNDALTPISSLLQTACDALRQTADDSHARNERRAKVVACSCEDVSNGVAVTFILSEQPTETKEPKP